jgi:hypothetical protein
MGKGGSKQMVSLKPGSHRDGERLRVIESALQFRGNDLASHLAVDIPITLTSEPDQIV